MSAGDSMRKTPKCKEIRGLQSCVKNESCVSTVGYKLKDQSDRNQRSVALNSLVADILQRINTNRCTFSLGHPLAPHQHGAVGGESVCFCLCVCECVSLSINETERERGARRDGVELCEGG